ncbi:MULTISPECIES: DevR family CRISPR-associated autoregulator [Brevibacillus]|jgi:CRISPR-associated autoregulator DevR family|uniref:CRISPR-associated protein DevR n=1 Tax=Brevibacillus parabrevis TaxID=54914 RepID=A0A4Y3PIB1_BREPA|nr:MULTISPECIES: DevR family CRISPR-associated autoregulator [Brevibacillus]MBU8715230.1 DevR family CRISPR-associated autoregulator [Brevibacillus parabrevis]MDH6353580.1 CRISPR-associated protein Cst2 [Brevibacillus sp. 1238]MDR4999835.1 DevR family CRISPR-associated autoregulator [Brevibacillus parabrevis]RNB93749.1 DevR family CRISPR-associated autoregulator [Brevibacillus parabrevis]WDV96105.1 DevR family CRISPR-associated autoregulator [Brevibacillus parabrevis]
MSVPFQSLSISGLLTLDMHALNNEGAEGNQLQTRMVHIVDGEGEPTVVNAISGDMLKHMQAEHLHGIAVEKGLPLCAGCQKFNANRINADSDFIQTLGDKNAIGETVKKVLQHCAVDDLEGVLITQGGRSTPRKSTVEFGWMIGLPDKTRTESYFHVKFDPNRGQGSGGESGANLGQNIFYRPASSGEYAVVMNAELSRVGFNDVEREHQIPVEARKERVKALLESVLLTFIKPLGAHRNTQFPHILNFTGVVSVSASTVPAPTVSPLKKNFSEELLSIQEQLNRLYPEAITTYEYSSQAEFTKIMVDLIEQVG